MSESKPSGRTGEFFVLAEALRAFKAGQLSDHPSDRALAKAADVSPTTIGDWLRGARFPQDIGKVLVVVRMVRGEAVRRSIAAPHNGPAGLLDENRWRAAHKEETRRRAGVFSEGVRRGQAISALAGAAARGRVDEVDHRLLGVHAAISMPGMPDEFPPEYVPRDVDAAEFGVRAKVAAAARRGGFVLLIGGSSVGKTRCAAEAVKTLLPDWWLVHPDGPAEIDELAQGPSPRTVVWLDELQRYLDGERGLTGGVVRALLNAPHPVVIIGTLWPDLYADYTAPPAPGAADPHAREREVLDLAEVLRIDPEFSAMEQDRASAAAVRDPRLRVALQAAGYGLTQTLAAAPQLVARWQDAKTTDPYAWAALTAALDAARLGARAPLSAEFLRAAAPGYCTSQQQAAAPENWFEQALVYATGTLHGAAAALSPVGVGMGQVAGYTVADYLIQQADRERRSARVPASTWDAVLSHICDPADTARLANSAQNRLLYRYAIPLYRHATDLGDDWAALQLADLQAERGDFDEAEQILRARADAGDQFAAMRLADLLAGRGDLDQLRARADAGDDWAAMRLRDRLAPRGDPLTALQLAERGDVDQLRARADAGDDWAEMWLVSLLAERGDLDQLRALALANAGDNFAATLLVKGSAALQLAERGDVDQLRARADAGDQFAAMQLGDILVQRGDLDQLRARADAGDQFAAMRLGDILVQRGDLDQLRARADAGDYRAARVLADTLGERGDLDQLRARADAGDGDAARVLADTLAGRGDLDQLRARADAGDQFAAQQLPKVLMKKDRIEEAEQLRRFGFNPDGSIASGPARQPESTARPARRWRLRRRREAARAADRQGRAEEASGSAGSA